MNESTGGLVPARRLVDFAPLKASPAFARLWFGGTVSGIGAFMTSVAVGLLIYDMTESTFAVGLVGGVSLLPMIIAGLWGGVVADVADRRRVLITTALVSWASTLCLVAFAFTEASRAPAEGHLPIWPLYAVTTLNAVSTTVGAAARGAVVGRLLPPDLISRAAALNGIAFGTMLTIGPALAGVLASTVGLPWTFAVDAVLFTAGFLGVWMLPRMPRLGERAESGWPVFVEGLRFLRAAPNIRMSFIVDILAMTFGRPTALLPALGALVVGGGPLTVGALVAAGAVGTILTSLFSGPVARVHRHGLAITRAIAAYGAFVALFGVVVLSMRWWDHDAGPGWSGVFWPALLLLGIAMAGMGAADEVSSIFRHTMLITAAPDQMRGRLQGVFIVVVTGGPRLGEMFAGTLAVAVALWFPPLVGGLAIAAGVGVLARVRWARGSARFLDYDARHPTP